MTSVPAPVTFAPMALRKLARSTICGSFAAFSMTVVPIGQDTGDHNIHRRADGDNVQVDSAADQASGRRCRTDAAAHQAHIRLHGLNTLDVLVDGPHTEVASAGQRHAGMAKPAQLRADEIIRRPDTAHQINGCDGIRHMGAVDFQCVGREATHQRAHRRQNFQQEPDVGDIGNIFNFTNTFDQQGRRQDGDCRVFRAADRHRPVQRLAAVYDIFRHGIPSLGRSILGVCAG